MKRKNCNIRKRNVTTKTKKKKKEKIARTNGNCENEENALNCKQTAISTMRFSTFSFLTITRCIISRFNQNKVLFYFMKAQRAASLFFHDNKESSIWNVIFRSMLKHCSVYLMRAHIEHQQKVKFVCQMIFNDYYC